MKIYFTASVLQMKELRGNYLRIINCLSQAGHSVKADHILDATIEKIKEQTMEEKIAYYQKAQRMISSADMVVAEASFPSTVNIGHEISMSLQKNIPTLVLFESNRSPMFILGLEHERLFMSDYQIDDLSMVLMEGLKYLSTKNKIRFNLLLSPKHLHHLEKKTKGTGIAKAGYIRNLIEKDIT